MKTHPIATRSRRDAILHAALELFAQQSFAATPVPVSAARAGHLNLNDELIAVAEERVWKLFER
jgi:hypothetical protein